MTAPRYDATLSSRRSFPSRVFRVIWRSIDCCRGHTPHHNALEQISEFECTESCLSPSSWASGRHVMKNYPITTPPAYILTWRTTQTLPASSLFSPPANSVGMHPFSCLSYYPNQVTYFTKRNCRDPMAHHLKSDPQLLRLIAPPPPLQETPAIS